MQIKKKQDKIHVEKEKDKIHIDKKKQDKIYVH